jgi:hypothetical protein
METTQKYTRRITDQPSKPWWHYGHAWLVVAGPLAVVIASFVTAYIAVNNRDPIVEENYYQKGIHINETLKAQNQLSKEQLDSLTPAVRARNHAATGATPE